MVTFIGLPFQRLVPQRMKEVNNPTSADSRALPENARELFSLTQDDTKLS